MLRKTNLLYPLIASAVAGCLITYAVLFFFNNNKGTQALSTVLANNIPSGDKGYDLPRLKGYQHVQPLLSAEPEYETDNYASLKGNVSGYIESQKNAGALIDASVYVCDFSADNWMDINPDAGFHPASMMKVVTLITYLRMAETQPGLLEQERAYEKDDNYIPTQHYNSQSIIKGKMYPVKELLRYMIAYSDNHATSLLNRQMDQDVYKKVLTDLGMPQPDLHDLNFKITAKDYSQFLKVLYNASYVSNSASEFAVSLLTECDFKDGIMKQLPADIKVAHKFGESGDPSNAAIHELHESGIIYLGNKPYLLTVMTRGSDVKKQAEIISNISKIVYDNMATGA